jgi:hypothetical protein
MFKNLFPINIIKNLCFFFIYSLADHFYFNIKTRTMKFIIIFYILFIFTFSVPTSKFLKFKNKISILILLIAFSYASHKTSLYDLLQKPLGAKANSLVLGTKNAKDLPSIIPNQQSNSNEDEASIQIRNNWDSGEDYYFQWANQNRRPVEYLTGRKREVEKVPLPKRDRRINGGLWRSGLVG